jgi:hypothetical protein
MGKATFWWSEEEKEKPVILSSKWTCDIWVTKISCLFGYLYTTSSVSHQHSQQISDYLPYGSENYSHQRKFKLLSKKKESSENYFKILVHLWIQAV